MSEVREITIEEYIQYMKNDLEGKLNIPEWMYQRNCRQFMEQIGNVFDVEKNMPRIRLKEPFDPKKLTPEQWDIWTEWCMMGQVGSDA